MGGRWFDMTDVIDIFYEADPDVTYDNFSIKAYLIAQPDTGAMAQ